MKLPSSPTAHRAAVAMAATKFGNFTATPWSKMKTSSASAYNKSQYLAHGILTHDQKRQPLHGLQNYLPPHTVSHAQKAIDNTPMWANLFQALKGIQTSGPPDFAHTARFFSCGGSNFAKAAGIPGGHWQIFLGLLSAVWASRTKQGSGLPKKTGPQPKQQQTLSNPPSMALYRTKDTTPGKLLSTRSEMSIVSLAAAMLTMLNQTQVGDESDPKLYWTSDELPIRGDYTAIIDGGLIVSGDGLDETCVIAGGELKSDRRSELGNPLLMQEGLEVAMSIKRRTPEFRLFPFLLYTLAGDQLYASFAKPTEGYVSFLARDHRLKDLAEKDYLTIERFGPYSVWEHEDLKEFVTILLAFQKSAYEWRASYLQKEESNIETQQEKSSGD